jgi:hypothetical protein
MNGDLAPVLLAAWIESARLVTVAREPRVRLMIAEPPTDFLEGGELGRLSSPTRASVGDAALPSTGGKLLLDLILIQTSVSLASK